MLILVAACSDKGTWVVVQSSVGGVDTATCNMRVVEEAGTSTIKVATERSPTAVA